MPDDLTPFLFEGDEMVRVVPHDDGTPWFVAADVCKVLGIKNSRDALRKLDEDEKGVANSDTPGGAQELSVVSESGLYALTFTSRKEKAKRFRKWVTNEVLPSIRTTGRYDAAEQTAVADADMMEKQPFPEWPLEELRTKKGVVEMYRRTYGAAASQWIAPQLGFPQPPRHLIENGRQMEMALTIHQGGA